MPHRVLFSAAVAAALLATPFVAAPVFAAGSDYSSSSSSKPSGPLANAESRIAAEDYAGALGYLEAAKNDDPDNADVYNLIGFSSRKLGNYEAAGAAYERALSLDPRHKGALEYQGELFLTLDRLDDAKANLARLDDICWAGCSEERELADAIAAYEATN